MKVKAVVRRRHSAPAMNVSVWGIMVPIPVASEFQDKANVTIDLPKGSDSAWDKITEEGPLRRTVALVTIPTHNESESHDVTLQVTYTATLKHRALVPGASPTPVPELRSTLVKAYTAESRLYDFRNPDVMAWMQAENLTRTKEETELQFGYRTLQAISRQMKSVARTYMETASMAVRTKEAAAGGLGAVFVSVMRANGIPARTAWGKLMPTVSSTLEVPSAYHVRSKFFAKGIGWIPVEVAYAAGKEDPSPWFGNDDGTFLVLHHEVFFREDQMFALQNLHVGFGVQSGTWEGETWAEMQTNTVTLLGKMAG